MANAAPVGGEVVLGNRQVPVPRERGRHGRVEEKKRNERKSAKLREVTLFAFCGEATIEKGGEEISGFRSI